MMRIRFSYNMFRSFHRKMFRPAHIVLVTVVLFATVGLSTASVTEVPNTVTQKTRPETTTNNNKPSNATTMRIVTTTADAHAINTSVPGVGPGLQTSIGIDSIVSSNTSRKQEEEQSSENVLSISEKPSIAKANHSQDTHDPMTSMIPNNSNKTNSTTGQPKGNVVCFNISTVDTSNLPTDQKTVLEDGFTQNLVKCLDIYVSATKWKFYFSSEVLSKGFSNDKVRWNCTVDPILTTCRCVWNIKTEKNVTIKIDIDDMDGLNASTNTTGVKWCNYLSTTTKDGLVVNASKDKDGLIVNASKDKDGLIVNASKDKDGLIVNASSVPVANEGNPKLKTGAKMAIFVGISVLVIVVGVISYNICSTNNYLDRLTTQVALARSNVRGWYTNQRQARRFTRSRSGPGGNAEAGLLNNEYELL